MKAIAAAIALSVALTACTTSGVGTASTMAGDVQATLVWESHGDRSGAMTATLSTGQIYSGSYFQITNQTQIDELHPLWDGWNPHSNLWAWGRGWDTWGYWRPAPVFITQYSGLVVANLNGSDGAHVRCKFRLKSPEAGMSGGGLGYCQLPDRKTIDATFPFAVP